MRSLNLKYTTLKKLLLAVKSLPNKLYPFTGAERVIFLNYLSEVRLELTTSSLQD